MFLTDNNLTLERSDGLRGLVRNEEISIGRAGGQSLFVLSMIRTRVLLRKQRAVVFVRQTHKIVWALFNYITHLYIFTYIQDGRLSVNVCAWMAARYTKINNHYRNASGT